MKENYFLDGVSNVDTDVVERFVSMDNRLQKKPQKAKNILIRILAIAACLAVVFGIIIAMPLMQPDDPEPDLPPNDDPEPDLPQNGTSIPGLTVVDKLSGKQDQLYGTPDFGDSGDADEVPPQFAVGTIVEAKVIEVLPDVYYNPSIYYGSSYTPVKKYHVARLSVIDHIFGDGHPDEIFLKYPYYSADIFEGHDTFVFSLRQAEIENCIMFNESQKETVCFSNLYEIPGIDDLGYGCVIAFRNGTVDTSFWDKTTHYLSHGYNPSSKYPAKNSSTVEEVKANIESLVTKFLKDGTDHGYNKKPFFDYRTPENVFLSDESRQIQEYIKPSESNVFVQQRLAVNTNTTIVTYVRTINGFLTEEKIIVNGYVGNEIVDVQKFGEAYTPEDIASAPDIGSAIEKLDLSELKPPHLEIVDGMELKCSFAQGFYRKANGKVYGIIRIFWYYTEHCGDYIMDDCYFLYDQDGNGSMVEREDLKALFGDDPVIARFDYGEWWGMPEY